MINKQKYFIYYILFFLIGCAETSLLPKTESISAEILKQHYGFKISKNQDRGDIIPPLPGNEILGKKVSGRIGSDTDWTAFTLVIHKNNNKYTLMTQKRVNHPAGTIETAGGHLLGGQSWREGARDELEQESGINVAKEQLIYLQGGKLQISKKDKLLGNVNFFIVFKKRPKTIDNNHEIDAKYGHQWLDLKDTYLDVIQEQNKLKHKSGKYYHNFRSHLIEFCTKVIDCAKL